jgi:hypothetical protein
VTGGWKKFHNKQLHNAYSSHDVVKVMKSRMRLAGHKVHVGEMRNAHRIVIKLEGVIPLGRYRHRLENNIKMDI